MSFPLRRLGPPLVAVVVLTLAALTAPAQTSKARSYLFCFWNMENLFDDRPNPKLEKVDREFDTWYSREPEALKMKLERLCEVLLSQEMNAGRGPDILCMAEVESQRAVELVRDALNQRLKDRSLHYKTLVYRDPQGGRSIATALISRVPVVGTPRLHGRFLRILEVHLAQGKHDLTILATHWTSRVSDTQGRGRANYASTIYDNYYTAYKRNPTVDYLVCGDFNDSPTDDAVVNVLGATGELKKVLALEKGEKPMFYNPFASLAKGNKGTHYYRDRGYVFDQICVSPGLLDGEGWSYVNNSAKIIEKMSFRGHPDRFGGPTDRRPWRNRGASDHYPITVQLRVQP